MTAHMDNDDPKKQNFRQKKFSLSLPKADRGFIRWWSWWQIKDWRNSSFRFNFSFQFIFLHFSPFLFPPFDTIFYFRCFIQNLKKFNEDEIREKKQKMRNTFLAVLFFIKFSSQRAIFLMSFSAEFWWNFFVFLFFFFFLRKRQKFFLCPFSI